MKHVKVLLVDTDTKLEPLINNAMHKLQEQGCNILDVTIIPELERNVEAFNSEEDEGQKYFINKQYTVKIFYDDNPVEERFKVTTSSMEESEARIRALKELKVMEDIQLKNQEEAIIAERY